MELTARDLARITGGTVVRGDESAPATSFSIDTRLIERGGCFVAVVAERDGHDYVSDAFARGARVAIASRAVADVPPEGAAIVQVDDPYDALALLGRAGRAALADAIVVGITGSAGKTGTKDLTAAALRPKFSVHASHESYNNEAGVPLTLLAAPAASEVVVLEMGARAPGDIAVLADIARPTVGVITNIGLAHAGRLGGREGVARAKGELLEALAPDGLVVLDADDPATPGLAARTAARVVLVSAGEATADVRAGAVTLDEDLQPRFRLESPWGAADVVLAVRGVHQVVNATLAAAVALASGVAVDDVAAGLATVQPAKWRMEVDRTASGVVVLDDAYNANPGSVAAALEALARIDVPGRRLAVLGEMLELGELSASEHAAVGDLVAAAALDALVVVGRETAPLAARARAAGIAVTEVGDAASALDAVTGYVAAGDAVLVKGSRAIGLELVAVALRGTAR
jgi:UDP-N-acetylmuramoyl-tripeptide--D-alanyl-D-alanine ligase